MVLGINVCRNLFKQLVFCLCFPGDSVNFIGLGFSVAAGNRGGVQ